MKTEFLFLSFTLLLAAAVGAVQTAAATEADRETIERSVSANRSLAARYRAEYAALLDGAPGGEEEEEDRDQRLNRLWDKIIRLEKENRNSLSRLAERKETPETALSKEPSETLSAEEAAVRPDGPYKPLLGEDWSRHMSRENKESYVFSAIELLARNGVFVTRPYHFYIDELDATIGEDAFFMQEYLDNLFITAVYENEPDTRELIDRLKRRALERLGLAGGAPAV